MIETIVGLAIFVVVRGLVFFLSGEYKRPHPHQWMVDHYDETIE